MDHPIGVECLAITSLKPSPRNARTAPGVAPGVRLIREWHGTKHVVDVTPDGFVWRDRTWRSLSAIAREITGARWSGPRFFGVKGQG